MAYSKVFSGTIQGLEPHLVEVEVNIDYQGFPGFFIVGLASKEIDEAKERVRSAIKNSGYQFPNRRITVNLAPADVPKRGSLYDLPIALAILKASGYVKEIPEDVFVMGELSLMGDVSKISGALPLTIFCVNEFNQVCLPIENAREVSIVKDVQIKPVQKLSELVEFLNGGSDIATFPHTAFEEIILTEKFNDYSVDLSDIKGQENAKRAIEIAAAGGHHLSMTGPPGAGKTLLANALVSILPRLTESEALEVTKLFSVTGQLDKKLPFVTRRPFRSPHHTASQAGIFGGGNPIAPGEISLAHHGVLFLDEFPEFRREVIEALRQPMEAGEVNISRATGSVTFPSRFMLVIASNPCPCGNLGHPRKSCTCSQFHIKRYQEKLSGPLLDRIDLHVLCEPVEADDLELSSKSVESSSAVRSRVQTARDLQTYRYQEFPQYTCNADLDPAGVETFCILERHLKQFLRRSTYEYGLSARGYHKVLKVSRTIADLEQKEKIQMAHLVEALQYKFVKAEEELA